VNQKMYELLKWGGGKQENTHTHTHTHTHKQIIQWNLSENCSVKQGCTNHGRQIAWATNRWHLTYVSHQCGTRLVSPFFQVAVSLRVLEHLWTPAVKVEIFLLSA
jgi:hypothetical protein